jgi:hypothetical protein
MAGVDLIARRRDDPDTEPHRQHDRQPEHHEQGEVRAPAAHTVHLRRSGSMRSRATTSSPRNWPARDRSSGWTGTWTSRPATRTRPARKVTHVRRDLIGSDERVCEPVERREVGEVSPVGRREEATLRGEGAWGQQVEDRAAVVVQHDDGEVELLDRRVQQPSVGVVQKRQVPDDRDDGRAGGHSGRDGDPQRGRDVPVDAGDTPVRMPDEVLAHGRVTVDVADGHR